MSKELTPMTTKIRVWFQQYGTWGGRAFTGTLTWVDAPPIDILGLVEQSETPAQAPAIILDDEQDGWSGLQLFPGQTLPGRFASGYCNSLAGKYYIGRLEIGANADRLKSAGPPSDVFPGKPSYLHLVEPDTPLTAEQRELLLEAIRYDREPRFAAGADITALFSREELEGEKRGQIFYA